MNVKFTLQVAGWELGLEFTKNVVICLEVYNNHCWLGDRVCRPDMQSPLTGIVMASLASTADGASNT